MNPDTPQPTNLELIAKEVKRLAISLLGAVLTAAALGALQWVGAHIPEWTQLLTMAAGARAAQIGNV